MKFTKLASFVILFFVVEEISLAQSYLMPTSGSANYTVTTGNFYDSGGSPANYSNNESGTVTFSCGTPGKCLQLAFASFNTQNGNDFLYIYDGPSMSYPLLGQFSGIKSPGTITGSLGSLTFVFTSTTSQTRVGW